MDGAGEGLVKKPQTVDIDDLMALPADGEPVYRFRCVEAWSMVIPWDGYSLSEFIKFCEPLPSAKYVQFISLPGPKQMPELPERDSTGRIRKGCGWMRRCIR